MYPVLKRVIDIVISGLAIVVLSPVLLLIAIAIKLDSKGPVLFKQKRVGKNKSHFMIYKFRSMYVDTPSDMPTHLLKDPTAMITKVGAFLRKTSLDELPQLFNIFKGEMAIVGPRPALWNQYDLIEERDKYGANNIRPGLTGWAQINGRDELEIDEKSKLDGYYVKNMSFGLDVKCFFGTFLSVVKSEGVVEGGTGQKGNS
ncbi:TPA: sugar transferase [Streptococcus suis]|nr:sugar transferase [Streptococcus suis]